MIDISEHFHDATISDIHVDFNAKTISISLLKYETPDSKSRRPVMLVFSGVSSFSQFANLYQIEKNAGFGNVEGWTETSPDGAIYLHLTGGCMSLHASTVETLYPTAPA